MPFELNVGGLLRTARVLVPPTWRVDHAAHGLRPVLYVFHDEDVYTPAQTFDAVTRFSTLVHGDPLVAPDLTKGRFIVVLVDGIAPSFDTRQVSGGANANLFPNDYPTTASFASGHRGRDAIALDIDDVAFVEALHEEIDARMSADLQAAAIDHRNVFAVGLGNGGEMAFRLASQWLVDGYHPLKGFAVFGGSNYGQTAPGYAGYPAHGAWLPPSGAVPPKLLAVGSSTDGDFLLDGLSLQPSADKEVILDSLGATALFPPFTRSVRSAVEEWVAGRATPKPPLQEYAIGPNSIEVRLKTEYESIKGAAAGLEAILYEQDRLGHNWPTVAGPGYWSGAVLAWDWFVSLL